MGVITTNYKGLIVKSVFKQNRTLVYHYKIKEPGQTFIDVRDYLSLRPDFAYINDPLVRNALVSQAYREYTRKQYQKITPQ